MISAMTLRLTAHMLLSLLASGALWSGGYLIDRASAQTPPSPRPSPAAPSTSAAWAPFESTTGGFRVEMPGKPTEQVQQLDTVGGAISNYIYSTTTNNGTVKYTVSYLDLPQMAQLAPASLILESIMGGIAEDAQSQVMEERAVSLAEHSGREIKITNAQQAIVVHRAFLVKQRVYQIAVEVPAAQEKTFAAESDRFLKSFKLL